MGAPAFAASIDDEAAENQKFTTLTDAITKNVKYANGVTVPAGQTFTFTFTQDTSTEGLVTETANIPNVNITSTQITSTTTGSQTDGTTTAFTNKGTINLSNLTKAGTYRYTVKESVLAVDSDTGYGWTSSDKEYTMTVVVQADGTKTYTIWDGTAKIDDLTKFAFTNTYTKRGGNDTTGHDEDNDGKQDSLVIEKDTSGSNIPSSASYNFTINFTKSATASSLPTTFTATKVTPAAQAGGQATTSTVTVNTTNGSFSLASGEKLVFDDIPAGTYYTVQENAAENAKASLVILANGERSTYGNNTANTALSNTTSALIGENENSATFTNTYSSITVTGIFNQYGGLLMVVAIAAVGIVLVAVRRRREA